MKYVSLFLRISRTSMEKIVHPAWDQPNQLFHLFQIWFSCRSGALVVKYPSGVKDGSELKAPLWETIVFRWSLLATSVACIVCKWDRACFLEPMRVPFCYHFFLQFTRSANKQYSLQTTQLDLDCELLVENLSRWITTFDIINWTTAILICVCYFVIGFWCEFLGDHFIPGQHVAFQEGQSSMRSSMKSSRSRGCRVLVQATQR